MSVKLKYFFLLHTLSHFHLFFKMLYDNFTISSFLREIRINISVFHVKRPQVEEPSCVCMQPPFLIWSIIIFHRLHNQIGCAVNLYWLFRHQTASRGWRGEECMGPGLGKEEILQAGSCSSSSLSFTSFPFFLQQVATHCLPYSRSCARHEDCSQDLVAGVSHQVGKIENTPQCEWHVLQLRNMTAWNSSL